MYESTPAVSVEYDELLDLDVDPGNPLLDRPVLVTVAERLPVETRIPASWVGTANRFAPGEPVQLAGDHPTRTRFRVTSFDTNNAYFVISHSAETCTPTSGIGGSTTTYEVFARGAVWACAFHFDPENPEADAWVQIDSISEFLDG